jgi:NAD(P)-dependent dehydrogenase (short-subunit alcohol dehydrogenase family)
MASWTFWLAMPAFWGRFLPWDISSRTAGSSSLDPLLRRSDAGRAIFVSSGVAGFTKPYWAAYAASKAALEMMVKVYAAEVERITPVRANILDPGVVRTAMRSEAFPGEDPMSLPHPDDIADIFVDLAEPACTRTGDVVRAY